MWNVELISDGPGSTIAGVLYKSLQLIDHVQVGPDLNSCIETLLDLSHDAERGFQGITTVDGVARRSFQLPLELPYQPVHLIFFAFNGRH